MLKFSGFPALLSMNMEIIERICTASGFSFDAHDVWCNILADVFDDQQLFVIFEFEDSGSDLESFKVSDELFVQHNASSL